MAAATGSYRRFERTTVQHMMVIDTMAGVGSALARASVTPASPEAALAAVMRLFVEEDRAHGWTARQRLHCDACHRPRPAPGFIQYPHGHLCNACATTYELRHMAATYPDRRR